ncbi:dTDP-4-dehydrorhamnose reductase [Yoonia sp. I 8.24]|uniref:dTDP-4-dehydrorhamnose reductase n=1 Tax=Yoonia sp. I 8.24 TaxID=1537229 RepID=UPI001EE12DE5|nr:dTDP-4-dehydrorhamnose reductase [Yoonia sp. I 8.24]MCG3267392.1 dTDP-4-dehydrorhamnose reductase [Yoonia sp. I 8.24]
MKILVLGKTGQVATALARNCPSDVTCIFLGREAADLLSPEICNAAIMAADVDAVINAAAFTAVDEAESEEQIATVINADAPGAMATACAQKNIPFLHLSTDYIFDGAGTHSIPPDQAAKPLSAYGRSKLAGEIAIRKSGARHFILRTSWVFSDHGKNFFLTMQRLGKDRDTINVVADQIGGPTAAGDIATALFQAARAMVDGHDGGTYHFCGKPAVSWAGFARAIMETSGLNCAIHDIPSSACPTIAERPANSRLDCTSLTEAFSIVQPDWRKSLSDIIAEQRSEAKI